MIECWSVEIRINNGNGMASRLLLWIVCVTSLDGCFLLTEEGNDVNRCFLVKPTVFFKHEINNFVHENNLTSFRYA